MKFVFASYVKINEFKEPHLWLNRIRSYSGIHKALGIPHEVHSIEQINYEGTAIEEGVTYHFLDCPKSGRYFPEKLHRFIKSQAPDVVVIHGLHFPLQVIQLRLVLGKKVKIIVQHHAERPFKGIKKHLQRWADHFVDAYFFASQEMGLDWVHTGNLKSPHKIHEVMELSSVFYPLDKQEAKIRTGVSKGTVFLWVGRLNKIKDPLNVVTAFLKFAGIEANVCLYMIYHTEDLLAEVQELLKDHPNKDAVVLIGRVAHQEMLYWFNSADFFISGSYYEGSGTAVCEAMSCGCMPIITNIFSFRMMTNNGACGVLYEPGNEVALLTALLGLQQMNVKEKQKASLTWFRSNLSFEAIAIRFQEVASSLLK